MKKRNIPDGWKKHDGEAIHSDKSLEGMAVHIDMIAVSRGLRRK